MAKSKSKHKGHGKPQGATYADVLARKAAIQRGIEKYATDKAMQIQVDTGVQRAMWLMVCSVADAFKIGPDRMKRDFFPALQANSDQLERMKAETDEDYAYEVLKRRAEQVTGIDIEYLYEHEMKAAGFKLGEGDGFVPMTRADKFREMTDEQLADWIEKYADDEAVGYCQRRPECYKAIGTGNHEFKCRECLLKWLREPVGGAEV